MGIPPFWAIRNPVFSYSRTPSSPGYAPAPTPCCAKSLQVCLASLLTLHALPAVVPSAATLIIVVCVGFLVLMVILGLVRIHSLHRRVSGASGPPEVSSDPKDPDLFWDDSALTIIVNPMEVSGTGKWGSPQSRFSWSICMARPWAKSSRLSSMSGKEEGLEGVG